MKGSNHGEYVSKFTMSSTENLCPAKSTTRLKAGYLSVDTAEGEQRVHRKHKGRFDRKKLFPSNIGEENKSFEGDKSQSNAVEGERAQQSVQDHRTLSDIGSREQVSKGTEYGGGTRWHSYVGRSFTADETRTVPNVQRQRGKQKRTSPSEEDLRRRACLNSMRPRRATSATEMPVTEVSGIDEKELHSYTHRERLDASRTLINDSRILDTFRTDAIDNLTRVAQIESFRLREYSRRLSLALKERAVLQEELKLLRLSGSLMSFNDDDDWRKMAKTSFRGETVSSKRMANSTSNNNRESSFEEPYAQPRQNRTLPKIPSIADPQVGELNIDDCEKENNHLHETKQTAKAFRKREELSNMEKERRESKTAELADHIWETLLQGQSFHVGEEATQFDDSTSEIDFLTKEEKNNSQRVKSEKRGTYSVLQRQSRVENNNFSQPSISYNERQKQNVASNTSMSSFGETSKMGERFCHGPAPHFVCSEAFRRDRGGRKALRHKGVSHFTKPMAAENSIPKVDDSQVSNTRRPEQAENAAVGGSEHVTHDHSKRFGYMLPPGMMKKNEKDKPPTSNSQRKAIERPPSTSEKLLYNHELNNQRIETETVFDLADAYMTVEDFEAKRALQKTAAEEAAILRRQASHLLWEALNLERICDPNGRVRHIFTPY